MAQPPVLLWLWLLGVLNNSAYVVMLAGANSIGDQKTPVGLVYFCGVLPTLMIKLSVPYWFGLVSDRTRMKIACGFMSLSYCTVALSTGQWQLLGVMFSALQSGIGEATCLGLCSRFGGREAVTAWSSGTGFAGPFGYGVVGFLHLLLRVSLRTTLLFANVTAGAWLVASALLLSHGDVGTSGHAEWTGSLSSDAAIGCDVEELRRDSCSDHSLLSVEQQGDAPQDEHSPLIAPATSTCPEADIWIAPWRARFDFVNTLWPYMGPLVCVYAAEYVLQAGVWTSIGVPTTTDKARVTFYIAANWCYQWGVFFSRSSGMLFQANRAILWLMPLLQTAFLGAFTVVAAFEVWRTYWLLLAAFAVGLIGGAVYVNAFSLISAEVPRKGGRQSFALAASSVADSIGIAAADLVSVWVQTWLLRLNGTGSLANILQQLQ